MADKSILCGDKYNGLVGYLYTCQIILMRFLKSAPKGLLFFLLQVFRHTLKKEHFRTVKLNN